LAAPLQLVIVIKYLYSTGNCFRPGPVCWWTKGRFSGACGTDQTI